MNKQVTYLMDKPSKEKFTAVTNPPELNDDPVTPLSILRWMMTDYRGNKPFGGLWTSTYTPDGAYLCDWSLGMATNALIQMGMANMNGTPWLLEPEEEARILVIDDLNAAITFTNEFSMQDIPFPPTLRAIHAGVVLTSRLTNWDKALEDCDAIRLTEHAADEVAAARLMQIDTAFSTWDCESTLWGTWKFRAVSELEEKKR